MKIRRIYYERVFLSCLLFLLLMSINAQALEGQDEKEKNTVNKNTSKEDEDNYFAELYKTMIINTSKFHKLINKYQMISYKPTDTELIARNFINYYLYKVFIQTVCSRVKTPSRSARPAQASRDQWSSKKCFST